VGAASTNDTGIAWSLGPVGTEIAGVIQNPHPRIERWADVMARGACTEAVLYKLSKTLAHVLSVPLALHHTLAPRPAQTKDEDGDSHKYDDVPPELALVVVVVIVLKMVYGLDGRPR